MARRLAEDAQLARDLFSGSSGAKFTRRRQAIIDEHLHIEQFEPIRAPVGDVTRSITTSPCGPCASGATSMPMPAAARSCASARASPRVLIAVAENDHAFRRFGRERSLGESQRSRPGSCDYRPLRSRAVWPVHQPRREPDRCERSLQTQSRQPRLCTIGVAMLSDGSAGVRKCRLAFGGRHAGRLIDDKQRNNPLRDPDQLNLCLRAQTNRDQQRRPKTQSQPVPSPPQTGQAPPPGDPDHRQQARGATATTVGQRKVAATA